VSVVLNGAERLQKLAFKTSEQGALIERYDKRGISRCPYLISCVAPGSAFSGIGSFDRLADVNRENWRDEKLVEVDGVKIGPWTAAILESVGVMATDAPEVVVPAF
jgi:hypothetical protein